jgi:hypothetical protein
MTDEELFKKLGDIYDSGEGFKIKRRPVPYTGEIPLTQIKTHRFDLIERAQNLGAVHDAEKGQTLVCPSEDSLEIRMAAAIEKDIPKHYTDGSQGRARCAVCDWTGMELDVEAVDWMTEDAICPECGIDAVYLEDPEESNV